MGLDLITLKDYKDYAGITSTNQDAEITALIPQVSSFVKVYCNRTFVDYYENLKTEVYNGGYSAILLPEFPIVKLVSFEYSYDYGKTYFTLTEYQDYILDIEEECVKPTVLPEFPKRINGYRIKYFGGYDLAELPADLKLAVIDLVEYYLKSNTAVHSQRTAGSNNVQIEYVTSSALPAHIRRVLDMYRGAM